MGNMSYCRFKNTLSNLQDCLEHIQDELEFEESDAREDLIVVCKAILAAIDED